MSRKDTACALTTSFVLASMLPDLSWRRKKNEKIGINTCPTYAASSCYKMKTSTIIVFLNTIPTPAFKKIHSHRNCRLGLTSLKVSTIVSFRRKKRSRDFLRIKPIVRKFIHAHFKHNQYIHTMEILSSKFHSELDKFDLKTTQTPPLPMSISKEREPFHRFLEL